MSDASGLIRPSCVRACHGVLATKAATSISLTRLCWFLPVGGHWDLSVGGHQVETGPSRRVSVVRRPPPCEVAADRRFGVHVSLSTWLLSARYVRGETDMAGLGG
jgi:hypothetical protein